MILWAMNNFFATYRSESNLLMNEEVSLRAIHTPPYKHSCNQIVSRDNAVKSHILALPLGTLCAR